VQVVMPRDLPIYLGNPVLLATYKKIHVEGINQSIRIDMLTARLSNSQEWLPEGWNGKEKIVQFATLKYKTVFRIYHGKNATPQYTYYEVPAGAKVKILMVSRFGDIKITDDMEGRVWRSRVHPDSLAGLDPNTEPDL
jgi:hypothetical protein